MFRLPLFAITLTLITPISANAQQKPIRPLSETVLAFEARGYVVRSAEDDGRTHEIEAINPQGRRIEALVEAATGEVLTERNDD
ncbi:PepSY domain-containing protein [Xinfangfangia sp. D13-10-4-6]|uniref:PepSY domain-containing protein n=1 Tax=Pseudogemmobacter hezensis TaxID=2737662 RepID=UPI001C12D17D|nr:PepSY domain-containing protein [Pseudogemmobacter hezensis]NPD16823.1 PepSY domain-containing protein [Pseudogemmobacter hezensis]